MEILESIGKEERSIIVTLPSNIQWKDYEKELSKVEDGRYTLNFKVHNFPKGITKGSRCYICHQGYVIGWMEIVGFSEKSFTCTTTGKPWKGKFVERSGKFHYINDKIPYRGFQGFRYFNINDYINND
jgi:hypothetical protein